MSESSNGTQSVAKIPAQDAEHGSPIPADSTEADQIPVEDTQEAGIETEETVESNNTSDSKPPAPPTAEQYQALERQNQEMLEEIEQMMPYVNRMRSDPAVLQALTGRQPTQQVTDPLDNFEESVNELFDEKPAAGLNKLLKPLINELKELREFKENAGSQINGMAKVFASNDFERGVRQGVDDKTLSSKEWQMHLRELRHNPNFRNDESRRGEYAALFAVSTWKAKKGTQVSYQKTRQTVEQAKNGNLNGGTSRSASGAGKVFELSTRDPDRFTRELDIRTKHPGATIRYKSPTKENN